MSNIPTVFKPKGAFSFLLSHIKEYNPSSRQSSILPHLKAFLADPTIRDLLKDEKPSAQDSSTPSNASIANTLSSLSKAILSMQKQLKMHHNSLAPATRKEPVKPSQTPRKTYSAVARTRPPNPSLIVELGHYKFYEGTRPSPGAICNIINQGLGKITLPQVFIAAARWTGQGNLVVTRDQYATPKSLQAAATSISTILSKHFNALPDELIPIAQPNVKWSKISINGIPSGVTTSHGMFNPSELHNSLIINNPSYALLPITQQPSWVCPPTSYAEYTVSSLSVAFEDPDGSKLRSLLAEKYLYIHRHRATICKWKQRQPICKGTSKPTAPKHSTVSRSDEDKDDDDIKIQLTPQPNPESQKPAIPSSSTPRAAIQTAPTQHSKLSVIKQAKTRTPNPPCNTKVKTRKVK